MTIATPLKKGDGLENFLDAVMEILAIYKFNIKIAEDSHTTTRQICRVIILDYMLE